MKTELLEAASRGLAPKRETIERFFVVECGMFGTVIYIQQHPRATNQRSQTR